MNFSRPPDAGPGPEQYADPAPSRTSQAVALVRASLSRPHSADGDPQAQAALCAGLTFTPPGWMRPSIEARTAFMDGQVVAAIAEGVRQVVICGAGLDDRALRFRTPGVRFFEVDHPITQADKARRLAEMGAAAAAPVLTPCDFQSGSVAAALASAGHAGSEPTLFLCEGLLVYLDSGACRRLLTGLAVSAATRSTLAVSLATHSSAASTAEVVAAANARRLTGGSEPWRTILTADEHLAMLSDAGWSQFASTDSPAAIDYVSDNRRTLLVSAQPSLVR